MRIALGAGGLAALSALLTAIVMPPAKPMVQAPIADDPQNGQGAQQPPAGPGSTPGSTPGSVQRPVQYVQLLPGETAPPGARVIDATAAPGNATAATPAAGKKSASGAAKARPPAQKPGGAVTATAPPAAQPVAQPVPQATPQPVAVAATVAPPAPAPTPIVIKTTQSGKVVP
jgi:hypothetical protein